MQDWIDYYSQMNSLQSINAFEYRRSFAMFIETYWLNSNRVNQLLSTVQYAPWIYSTTPDPTGFLDFNNSASWNATQLAQGFISGGGATAPTNAAIIYNGYYANQKVVFMQTLLQSFSTNLAIITMVDNTLNCTAETNPEVRMRWYTMGLYLQYAPVYTPAQNWVSMMGRNKYLHAIYTSLAESSQTATG